MIQGTTIGCYISRLFNEKIELVNELKIFRKLTLRETSYSEHYIDVDEIVNEFSIPNGYYLEIIAFTFNISNTLFPIFPHELRIEASESGKSIIEKEFDTLSEISGIFELSSYLRNIARARAVSWEASIVTWDHEVVNDIKASVLSWEIL